MKYLSVALLSCIYFLFFSHSQVSAISDPFNVANNQYGIHIIDENDLKTASELVNSSGGDWGYVTIVISENERKVEKWNEIFKKMREYHLIPLVRLATRVEDAVWKAPLPEDVVPWVDFLNRLEWVSQNRYVILFNEPNHAKEWGGTIAPVDYGKLVASFSASLKEKSNDFYILPAGLDVSAPTGKETLDAKVFLKTIHDHVPEYFDSIDGWTSHSYPNPGFSGSVNAFGRGTLRSFIWEKSVLAQLGIQKELPVFITETGWAHAEGTYYDRRFYSSDTIASFFIKAAQSVWTDTRIVAITPFVLTYQGDPFSHFSWQKLAQTEFYDHFYAYQGIEKTAGNPILAPTFTPTPTLIPSPTLPPSSLTREIVRDFLRIFPFFIRAKT